MSGVSWISLNSSDLSLALSGTSMRNGVSLVTIRS